LGPFAPASRLWRLAGMAKPRQTAKQKEMVKQQKTVQTE
jgi:hypothetical protein